MNIEAGGAIYYVARDFEIRDGISVLYARVGSERVARLENDLLATQVLSDLAPADTGGDGTLTPKGDMHITVADAWLAQASAAGIVNLAAGTTASPVSRLLKASARRMLLDAGDPVASLHSDHLGSLVVATDSTG